MVIKSFLPNKKKNHLVDSGTINDVSALSCASHFLTMLKNLNTTLQRSYSENSLPLDATSCQTSWHIPVTTNKDCDHNDSAKTLHLVKTSISQIKDVQMTAAKHAYQNTRELERCSNQHSTYINHIPKPVIKKPKALNESRKPSTHAEPFTFLPFKRSILL